MIWNTHCWYGSVTRWLHWLIGIAFILMVIMGFVMGDLPKSIQATAYMLHKSTGTLLLGLVVLRFIWRMMNIEPLPSSGVPGWQIKAAKLNIWLLYVLMLLMPLSGFLMSFLGTYGVNFYGLFNIGPWGDPQPIAKLFHEVHGVLPYVLIALFTTHVAGALHHHFILKDNTLRRMLRSE
jgi:cytochrome b561